MVDDADSTIVIYGTNWCGGSRRARLLLEENHIPYRFVDIESDEEAAEYVESLANGYRSVPTIVWPDDSYLVEPSGSELAKKLGI
jgi:glutaredoxin